MVIRGNRVQGYWKGVGVLRAHDKGRGRRNEVEVRGFQRCITSVVMVAKELAKVLLIDGSGDG